MRKRMTSLLLTLVMLLSLVPAMGVTASAAEPWVTVNSFKELQDAVKGKKEYIKLGQDIDTTSYNEGIGLLKKDELTFDDVYYYCTIDLNGKTLALVSNDTNISQGIYIGGKSHLTIQDTSSAKSGKISGAFSNVFGGQDAKLIRVNGSTLTLEGGTFTVTSLPYKDNAIVIDSLESFITIKDGVKIIQPEFNDLGYGRDLDGSGYTLKAENSEDRGGRVIIEGGEFVGCVKLTGSQAENGSVQINGGTFKKGVQVMYAAEENNSNPAVTVNGGTFEGDVYLKHWPWKTSLYMPYRLNGGTFKGKLNLHADSAITTYDKPEGNSNIALGLDKCFGYSAVVATDGTFTGPNAYTAVLEKTGNYYEMWLKGSASNPIRIIPNAWGMKSVTLDNVPIDYFKDWKGTVENLTNDKEHTLKFEWYPLAQELKDAGYTYRANFDCYTVGSNTPTTSVPISATAIEYSHTILAGAAPSVYPFDLQLNLDKNGSSVGIFGNQHIVKLVVNPAPVVTEISSAPVKLSAALTPGTSAPSATAVGSGYTVDSIKWYTNNECTTEASSFVAGTEYYGKIVLKPEKNYKFAASASALLFCDDPNENYAGISSTVAEDGSSLTRVVKGTAVSALVWNSVDANNQTYTIGDNALTLNAKATGGESGKPITYKLITKKDSTETVKASAMVAASSTDSFSASLSFTDTGSYECWFEATRGNVTITSDHFTVTVNAPGLSITNQSGDLTVKQNETARLFVKAVGHGVKYQWQVKNGETWDNISSATDYDYAAPTADVGEKTYHCKVTDKYGAFEYTNEMTVTVTEGTNPNLTPAIPLAAVNGEVPNPAQKWSDKEVPAGGWLGLPAEYDVTAGDTFHGVAAFSTIPKGFTTNQGSDIYYGKTPVLGTISYEWKGTTKNPWDAVPSDFTSYYGTNDNATITMPDEAGTYYVVLSVTNTIGEGYGNQATSTVYITFHVSAAHTHTYAYAQLNETNHTKYCTAGDESTTEGHTLDTNGMCTLCGYAPATYTVTVTDGTATHYTGVAPGTKVTLTANTAPSGQEFDKWVGNVAVASDNTFTMPSHNVTVAATYKPIAHTHDTDAQSWVYMDPGTHTKTCTAGDDFKMEAHTFSAWTDNGNGTHSRHCTACKMTDGSTYTETAEHTWVWVVDHEAALNQPGKQHEECTGCHAERNKNTEIPALTAISAVNVTVTAPVKGATLGTATTADTTYNVAATDWDPTVSGTFAGGIKYTVKVSLEAIGNNRFTNSTTFQINGKTATVVGTLSAAGKDNTVITLAFPATSSGSTGGGGGGGVTTYPITVKSAKNGDVTASHKSASKGTTVTLTVDPDKGYVLDTLTVLDGKDKELKLTEKNGKYTFTMPASKVTVAATFKASAPTGKNPFVDVPAGSYYEDAVVWAVEKGITSGTSAVTFDPNGNCTRAQAVTFLWRAAGSPAPKTKVMPFTDVPAGSYYYDAVLWAMEQGITKGTSDTAFSPNATCTRAQIVTFLWRANGSPAVSGNSAFTDVAADAYYAAAVAWAEKNGVTGGIGNGLFGSGNNCTRAQIVTFLYRSVK